MMQLMLEAEVEETKLDNNDNLITSNLWESPKKSHATTCSVTTVENGKTPPLQCAKEDVMIPLEYDSTCKYSNGAIKTAETNNNNNIPCSSAFSRDVEKNDGPKIYSNGLLKKTSKKLTTEVSNGNSKQLLIIHGIFKNYC